MTPIFFVSGPFPSLWKLQHTLCRQQTLPTKQAAHTGPERREPEAQEPQMNVSLQHSSRRPALSPSAGHQRSKGRNKMTSSEVPGNLCAMDPFLGACTATTYLLGSRPVGLEMAQLLKALATLPAEQRPMRKRTGNENISFLETSREPAFYSQNLHFVLTVYSHM